MNQFIVPADHPCSAVSIHFTTTGTLCLDQGDDSVVMTAKQREHLASLLASRQAVAS